MAKEYDVVIIGGGPGGYVAAIRASQLGLSTALVEKREIGGTCLHKGCIPSKVLLRSAEVYQLAKKSEEYGVNTGAVSLNFPKMHERKNKVIDTLYKGIQQLMKKGKIDVYNGIGRIMGPSIFSPLPGTVSVEMNDGSENEMLLPKNVIIATGSRPRLFSEIDIDGEYVLTSDEALQMQSLPKSLLIVGGGVIGIEWASMMSDFGVEVTVVEFASTILPTEDEAIAKEMQRLLRKKNVMISTNTKLIPETFTKSDGQIAIKANIDGNEKTFVAEKMLISIGRLANVEGIGLENTEIQINSGYIETNEHFQTKESHIYAIGDCIGGLQLAHVASHEGIAAVEHIKGIKREYMSPAMVPKCVYSNPEVASVGLTEADARAAGYEIKIGMIPFKAIGKALILGESEGFVKIIADSKSDDLLGVHMIGPHVTDLISEAGLAKVLNAVPWEISYAVHPHPSLSEIFGEAALAIDGEAIHF
ncbi:dihydrolipoyl dehydrogenase [Bacillus sp. AGMB 02131]|uniref:Dihydrolipoyl dehydrogenase n=1 Tax=Peribacillus faecalis TaxID=2772559 RepID=A0A927CUJ6_9BACI|nr:dihydrolipoyl dehydrogenase [Peribacillus faecalis]MBD3108078.1 dihydrolipoyl dehydrogenase [Peribacillus faecalis]